MARPQIEHAPDDALGLGKDERRAALAGANPMPFAATYSGNIAARGDANWPPFNKVARLQYRMKPRLVSAADQAK